MQDVVTRLLGAVMFNRGLFAEIEAKPDLYGPFWVSTTVVFLMAMASNAVDWLADSGDSGDRWHADVTKMVHAAAILYGYVFGAGGLLWVWLKVISQAAISLASLWCLYGAPPRCSSGVHETFILLASLWCLYSAPLC